jgi:phosphate transport system permease protein
MIGSAADPSFETNPLAPSDHWAARADRPSPMASDGGCAAGSLVLGTVVWSVFSRGVSVLSLGFLTNDLPTGIAPAIVGTAVLIAIATVIAMPLGILIALYETEFAGMRSGRALRLVLDVMNGIPTIITGLFVFGLLVVGHHQAALRAFALSIVSP